MQLETSTVAEKQPRAAGPSATGDRRLRQELRQAAQTGAFTLAYQPRRDLARDVVVGAALQLRWPRKRGGTTPASGFMPLLQANGLATDVAAWALNSACQEAAGWAHGQVCVAADSGALRDGLLLHQVGQALAASGLPPERLEIELSEPALAADTDTTLLTLAALRDLGVSIALDAFGSESASLLPLKRLPLTALKLDRSLIRDLPDDREAAAIVEAATLFAHALDIVVVACGLETAAQRAFLQRIGCDEAQGSLCGRVVPAWEIGELLA
jgi:EAL domain-containing protein (putative c-di-GMP-specific phosphodiesterase class I)